MLSSTFPSYISIESLAVFLGIEDIEEVRKRAKRVTDALARHVPVKAAVDSYYELIAADLLEREQELSATDLNKGKIAVIILIALTQRHYWVEEYLHNLEDAFDWALADGYVDVKEAVLTEIAHFEWRQNQKRRKKKKK